MDDEQLEQRRSDNGFSLIELLVVVIVIAVVSAIAIPMYMQQRARAYDSAVTTDLRHLAKLQEERLNYEGTYGGLADLTSYAGPIEVSPEVELQVVTFDPVGGYCLAGRHRISRATWYYDSSGGGLQRRGSAGCPTAYSTPDGTAIS